MGGSAEMKMERSGAENGGWIWGWKWRAVGLKMGSSGAEIPNLGAVLGLKMGGSAEIPNVGPVQALKMGRNGAENGGQR